VVLAEGVLPDLEGPQRERGTPAVDDAPGEREAAGPPSWQGSPADRGVRERRDGDEQPEGEQRRALPPEAAQHELPQGVGLVGLALEGLLDGELVDVLLAAGVHPLPRRDGDDVLGLVLVAHRCPSSRLVGMCTGYLTALTSGSAGRGRRRRCPPACS